jgi:hypothetical protein
MSKQLKRPREAVQELIAESQRSAYRTCDTVMKIIDEYESKIAMLQRKNTELEEELFLHNTSVEAMAFVKQAMTTRNMQNEVRRQQIRVYDKEEEKNGQLEIKEEKESESQADLADFLMESIASDA